MKNAFGAALIFATVLLSPIPLTSTSASAQSVLALPFKVADSMYPFARASAIWPTDDNAKGALTLGTGIVWSETSKLSGTVQWRNIFHETNQFEVGITYSLR